MSARCRTDRFEHPRGGGSRHLGNTYGKPVKKGDTAWPMQIGGRLRPNTARRRPYPTHHVHDDIYAQPILDIPYMDSPYGIEPYEPIRIRPQGAHMPRKEPCSDRPRFRPISSNAAAFGPARIRSAPLCAGQATRQFDAAAAPVPRAGQRTARACRFPTLADWVHHPCQLGGNDATSGGEASLRSFGGYDVAIKPGVHSLKRRA